MLNEFYWLAFCKKIYQTIDKLQPDLVVYPSLAGLLIQANRCHLMVKLKLPGRLQANLNFAISSGNHMSGPVMR